MIDEPAIDKLYTMKFNHSEASGDFELLKEIHSKDVLYWINTSETTKSINYYRDVMVKFTTEDLLNLRSLLNDLDLEI